MALPDGINEFRSLLKRSVLPRLDRPLAQRRYRLVDSAESEVVDMLKALEDPSTCPAMLDLKHISVERMSSSIDGITLHVAVQADGAVDADRRLAPFEEQLQSVFGTRFFGVNNDDLAQQTLALCSRARLTIAISETASSRGGLAGVFEHCGDSELSWIAGSTTTPTWARFLASTRDTQPVEWLKAPHQDENDSDDQDHCIEAAVHVKQLFGSSIGISLSVDSHRQLAVIGIAPPIGEPIRSEISISDHNDHNAGHHINRHAGLRERAVTAAVLQIRQQVLR